MLIKNSKEESDGESYDFTFPSLEANCLFLSGFGMKA
jgi:hypothetical protein